MPLKSNSSMPLALELWYRGISRLYTTYAALTRTQSNEPRKENLRRQEKKVYSQNGEDGLLEYIFSKIGVTSRSFVEIGCEIGVECNTANLSLKNSWSGLLVDANEEYIKQARAYYQVHLGTAAHRVNIQAALVTVENINDIVSSYAPRAIDLLSIDVDGIDYYLWQKVSVIDPRVVVIEYNASIPPTLSVTVKYNPTFERFHYHPSGYYHGASLTALAALGARKGYALIGCDSEGVNAFFVKQELTSRALPSLTPVAAYYPCNYRLRTETLAQQYRVTEAMDFVNA